MNFLALIITQQLFFLIKAKEAMKEQERACPEPI